MPNMNTGGPADLAQQVERTLRELRQTYDDIGITSHEKEQRTQNVYKALQDCLREQVNATNRYGNIVSGCVYWHGCRDL